MSESLCIDSRLRRWTMPKSYSGDLRERVIEAVEAGASRREAGERFEIHASSSGRWLQRLHESPRGAAEARRGNGFPPGEVSGQGVWLHCLQAEPDFVLNA